MAETGKAKGGLGRGLASLIPAAVAPAGDPGTFEISVDLIERNPRQPRQEMNPAELEELTSSIRQHGLLQPIVVSRVAAAEGRAERYELIAGERRLAAARLAGLRTVPVVFRTATPEESLELALVENIQRSDLSPLDEAEAYRHLMDEFGLTQEQVAGKVGKSRPTVANSLRLLGLVEEAKAELRRGTITEGHARALLGLREEDQQRSALGKIIAGNLSVRATEVLVRDKRDGREQREPSRDARDEIRAIEDSLRAALGTRVSLIRRGTGGQLVIHFYSDEQLQALYELLTRE